MESQETESTNQQTQKLNETERMCRICKGPNPFACCCEAKQAAANAAGAATAAGEPEGEGDDDTMFAFALEGGVKKAVKIINDLFDSEDGKKFLATIKRMNSAGSSEQLKGIAFLIKYLGEEICEQIRQHNELQRMALMHRVLALKKKEPGNVTDEDYRTCIVFLRELTKESFKNGGDADGSETLS